MVPWTPSTRKFNLKSCGKMITPQKHSQHEKNILKQLNYKTDILLALLLKLKQLNYNDHFNSLSAFCLTT
jgi:hypothetical protein